MYYKADIDIVDIRTLSRKLRPPAKASFATFTKWERNKKLFKDFKSFMRSVVGRGRGKSKAPFRSSELQKDFFRPVSRYSTKKCPYLVSAEFCHNMTIKLDKCLFSSQFSSFGVELFQKSTVLEPF